MKRWRFDSSWRLSLCNCTIITIIMPFIRVYVYYIYVLSWQCLLWAVITRPIVYWLLSYTYKDQFNCIIVAIEYLSLIPNKYLKRYSPLITIFKMNNFLLDLLSFAAVLSGILVITSTNPVISVLFLISVFINAAGYLLLLGVGFVGISYLIVYVGAIAILFLFVVMMLNIRLTEIVSVGREYTKNLPLGFIVGSLFFFEVLSLLPASYSEAGELPLGLFNYINGLFLGLNSPLTSSDVHMTFTGPGADDSFSGFLQIEAIGQGLYTYGSLWLLLASIILLLAMLGPIALCLRSANDK